MHCGLVEAGEGVLSYQDLTRQDVEKEPTGMYLWRVLVRQYPLPSAPLRADEQTTVQLTEFPLLTKPFNKEPLNVYTDQLAIQSKTII